MNRITNNGYAIVVQLDCISLNSTTNSIQANTNPMYDYCHIAMKKAKTKISLGNWYTHIDAN